MEKRVVITGLGVVSPVGNNVGTFWKNLIGGYCGIDFVTEFPTDDLSVKIAGTLKNFNPADDGIEAGFVRRQDKFSVYGMAAANQAMAQSGLKATKDGIDGNISPDRLGVYVGSGIGGFNTIYKECVKMDKEGAKWVSPILVPAMISNICAGNIAIRHNACGPPPLHLRR